jgi:hypothetical protein
MGFDDLTKVRAILFYTKGGVKMAAQYYDSFIPEEEQPKFESSLWQRFSEDLRTELLQFDRYLVVCRAISDMMAYVVGDLKCNELLLAQVVDTIDNALELVCKKVSVDGLLDKLENQTYLYLLLDEVVDQGYVFEGNPEIVAARISLKDDNAFQGKAIRAASQF